VGCGGGLFMVVIVVVGYLWLVVGYSEISRLVVRWCIKTGYWRWYFGIVLRQIFVYQNKYKPRLALRTNP